MKSETTTKADKNTTSSSESSKASNHMTTFAANAYVAFGSNLEEPLFQLQKAYKALSEEVEIVIASSIYKTAPVGGPAGQDDFLNAVVGVQTNLSAQQLLKVLHRVEAAQGRERSIRWDARTLDLDLLSFKTLILDTKRLVLPHPRMMERAFVLVPLCEIAPDWRHPLTKKSAKESLNTLDVEDIEKTELSWV